MAGSIILNNLRTQGLTFLRPSGWERHCGVCSFHKLARHWFSTLRLIERDVLRGSGMTTFSSGTFARTSVLAVAITESNTARQIHEAKEKVTKVLVHGCMLLLFTFVSSVASLSTYVHLNQTTGGPSGMCYVFCFYDAHNFVHSHSVENKQTERSRD